MAETLIRGLLRVALLGKRFERVIIVCGLRRSGHHAVINWIVNGLKAGETHITYDARIYIGWSTMGKAVHLNDVKLHPDPRFLAHVLRSVRRLRRASFLIVSYEDVPLDGRIMNHHLAAGATDTVLVRRSVPNLVASRLEVRHRMEDDATADYQMPLDDGFFAACIDHVADHGPSVVVIRFDDFVSSDEYRDAMARRLGLQTDAPGDITIPAGGSSFTGRSVVPSPSDLRSRWQQVDWPPALLDRLWDLRTDLRLSDDETRTIDHLRKTSGLPPRA